jgi:hypothetical protein
MTWHLSAEAARAYIAGSVADADAWSIEAHLTACERCRGALADMSQYEDEPRERLQARWTAMAADLPAQGRVRSASTWREAWVLVSGGHAARWAWLTACALVLVLAAAVDAIDVARTPWLGIVAPLAPLLGVAASYGSRLDSAYELIAATPAGGLRLLLVRSASVLAITTPIALVAGGVTGYGSPVPWLLASLALVLATLALGSVIGIEPAAAVMALAWIASITSTLLEPGRHIPALLTLDAAPWSLAVAVVAGVVVTARRASFNELPGRPRIEVSR